MTKAYDWWKHENNLPFFFVQEKDGKINWQDLFPPFPVAEIS